MEGLTMPPGHLKNLKSAADDQQLKDILENIRSAKSSVRCPVLLFYTCSDVFFYSELLISLRKQFRMQHVGFCETGRAGGYQLWSFVV